MDNSTIELIINGSIGLLGAIIGGGASLLATQIQINHKEKEDDEILKEKRKRTVSIIKTFLIKEISSNIDNIKFLETYFEAGYENSIRNSVNLSRELAFEEYNLTKYQLLESDNLISLQTTEIYHMFYMVSSLNEKEKLNEFTKNEFNYMANRYDMAKKLVESYHEKKYEHF